MTDDDDADDDISIYEMNEGSGPWITAQEMLLQKCLWISHWFGMTDKGGDCDELEEVFQTKFYVCWKAQNVAKITKKKRYYNQIYGCTFYSP